MDAYWTPIEAVKSLMVLEDLPKFLWEPACGNGAIVNPLREAGFNVIASDIEDYGCELASQFDYFQTTCTTSCKGIVTNPPFKLALDFAKKALSEVNYVALYLRLNWLEGVRRKPFFQENGPTRVWISSRRLPMMHRHGWEGGKISSSNIAFAWYIWDNRTFGIGDPDNLPAPSATTLRWFDWKEFN